MKLFVRSGVKEEITAEGCLVLARREEDVNNNLGFLAQNEGGENREVDMNGV